MQEKWNLIVTFTTMLALTACGSRALGGLTAFAVPSAPSADSWASLDSGWAAPLNISGPLLPPYLVFNTVATPTGLRWQAWGGLDPNLSPGAQQTTALATRILSNEMIQGQTFRFGLDSTSGVFDLGNIGVRNSASVGLSIAAGSTYAYSDNGTGQDYIDTGVSTSNPVDVQVTWTDTVANTYTAKITVIGSATPAYTWTGEFRSLTGQDLNDTTNHLNGFMVINQGSPSAYVGVRYIEVGSGVLPDPATLVPEPELVACFPMVVASLIARRRR